MKRISRLVLATSGMILCSHALATTLPNGLRNNNTNSTPFLGPTLRMSTTSYLTDMYAYSLLGELGVKNIRGSGTFGIAIADNQRIKFTAEALSQELAFSFDSNDNNQWVYQGAVGADYVYDLNWPYNLQFDLNGYYSYAPNKTLNDKKFVLRPVGSFVTTITNERRIAGSSAYGVNPGLGISPWDGTRLFAELNYDNVTYRTRFGSNRTNDAKGFGGTIGLNQLLTEDLALNLSAEIRKPFNYYSADLYYQNYQFMGRWAFGLFGDYVNGKFYLENSWNLGFHADYFFDPCVSVPGTPPNVKGERDLKGEDPYNEVRVPNPFVTWVSDPAVRMPQVLAVVDQRLTSNTVCTKGAAPKLIAPIPNQSGIDAPGMVHIFHTAQYFSGSNLVFSGTYTDTYPGTPRDRVKIKTNGNVVVILADPDGQTITINVTATNDCGSATGTFVVLAAGGGGGPSLKK